MDLVHPASPPGDIYAQACLQNPTLLSVGHSSSNIRVIALFEKSDDADIGRRVADGKYCGVLVNLSFLKY